jgi:hypothetical protein
VKCTGQTTRGFSSTTGLAADRAAGFARDARTRGVAVAVLAGLAGAGTYAGSPPPSGRVAPKWR